MFLFRPLCDRDLEFLNEIRNECAKDYLHDSRKFTLEQTKEWFNKTHPDYYIINYANNDIGYFRISQHSILNKNLYIGADIHKNFRGKKLAYYAYIKFIPFLFKRYNLNKISLEVLSTNTRAYNLYNKLGFKQEGIKRQEVYKNGIYIDSIIMSILKDEFYGSILEN